MTAEAHYSPIRPPGRPAGTARATENAETAPAVERRDSGRRSGLRLLSSSLTRRILAINLLVLAVPIGGVFYLDQYQQSLVEAEIETLRVQGEIFSGALGAGAVAIVPGVGQRIEATGASILMRRLVAPTRTRARLFATGGDVVVDTRDLVGRSGVVRIEELPPPNGKFGVARRVVDAVNAVIEWRPGRRDLPVYREQAQQSAFDYAEVRLALLGNTAWGVRGDGDGGMVLTVAVPVQRYKQVVGAVLLSTDGSEVERNLRAVRLDVLRVFGIALMVTVLLSLYLSGTIARPLRRLAAAAERMRRSKSRHVDIPDLSARDDEIGELSASLRDMTEALWTRLDAIERFAADVAHEIKNPLTSLRSAVETVARVNDAEQQRKLMAIILDDVQRLDHLISDISHASRLDAELSRDELEPVDLGLLLGALVEIEEAGASTRKLRLDLKVALPLVAYGIEGRLGQVFRNVIQNAISFSPPEGVISIRAERTGDRVHVLIEDDGPGIPESKLEAVFDRFYTDRREDRAARADNHSGLGLSISKQIVEAGGGRIWAQNRRDAAGEVRGTCFVIELLARRD